MTLWQRLRRRLSPLSVAPPSPPPQERRPAGLPATFRASMPDDGAERPEVFDPALLQFRYAFRAGDPAIADPGQARRWAGLRRLATDHVLRRVAESPWGDQLILRGSRAMQAWFGDAAREPGDLDFVYALPDLPLPQVRASGLFDDLAAAVLASPAPAGVEFVADAVASEDIWTYERAPGRRVVFPWRAPGLPGGAVQVDVVFGERLAEPDRREEIAVAGGGRVSACVATPAQSLAWKLLWLATDVHGQGKDLYDAVLLAERFPLPIDILERTFAKGDAGPLPSSAEALVAGWSVEWSHFRAEYPRIDGDEKTWLARLAVALGPTFASPISP